MEAIPVMQPDISSGRAVEPDGPRAPPPGRLLEPVLVRDLPAERRRRPGGAVGLEEGPDEGPGHPEPFEGCHHHGRRVAGHGEREERPGPRPLSGCGQGAGEAGVQCTPPAAEPEPVAREDRAEEVAQGDPGEGVVDGPVAELLGGGEGGLEDEPCERLAEVAGFRAEARPAPAARSRRGGRPGRPAEIPRSPSASRRQRTATSSASIPEAMVTHPRGRVRTASGSGVGPGP